MSETEEYAFQDCCRKALKDIAQNKKVGRTLEVMLVASPFVLLYAPEYQIPEALFKIAKTDWGGFARAVESMPSIVRERCLQIAEMEQFNHSMGQAQDRDLGRFWKSTSDAFR